MIIEPATLTEQGYGLLKAHTGALLKKINSIVKEKNAELKFEQWLGQDKKDLVKKLGRKEAEIVTADIKLFFQLAGGFIYVYLTGAGFGKIGIIPDKERRFGELDMNNYFIHLSFLTSREIHTKESILQNETEMNKNKIRVANEEKRKVDKDYIVHYDFNSISRLLVAGSPGVGKSTFAKWLCHWWQDNPEKTSGIPVYIELKQVNFASGTNALVSYIVQEYFPELGSKSGEIHALLHKLQQQFLFILDGYDELSEQGKQKLYHALQQLSSGARYIVTSRPYGILETYGLSWEQAIQLNGFDDPNIERYLQHFIESNPAEGKSAKDLKVIIDHNPVLLDFAHNPLLLSFMVYIYLSDDNARTTLQRIESRFKLQEIVTGWVFAYHSRKGGEKAGYELLDRTAELAFNMETDKQLSLTLREQDVLFAGTMKPLALMGIGQVSVTSNNDSARFFFSSATFQEYFASIHFAKKFTSRAFDYIVEDSFFWNLCAMVTGQLNEDENLLPVLTGIVERYEKRAGDINRNYAFYNYLLIISECNNGFIHELLTRRRVRFIFGNFKKFITDERLRYGLSECMQRIYLKMDDKQQQFFKELIISSLTKSWKPNHKNFGKVWDDISWIIDEPMNYFGLDKDEDFVEELLTLLLAILSGIPMNGTFITLPAYLVDRIKEMPDRFFTVNKKNILEAAKLIPYDYLTDQVDLESRFKTAEDVLEELGKNVGHLENRTTNIHGAAVKVAAGICAAGNFVEEFERSGRLKDIEGLISKSLELFNSHDWFSKWDNKKRVEAPENVLRHLVIAGMIQFDNTGTYLRALELMYSTPEINWDVDADKVLNDYLSKFLSGSSKLQVAEKLSKLIRLFSQVTSLRHQLPLYRENLMNLYQQLVDENYTLLTSDKFIADEKVRLKDGIEVAAIPDNNWGDDLVINTLRSFHRLIAWEETYDSDRRYFINRMLDGRFYEMKYYRDLILPELIKQNYMLTGEAWDYLFDSLEQDVDTKIAVFKLLQNDSIYQNAGNLPRLEELVEKIYSWKEEDWFDTFITSCKYDVMAVLTDILFLLTRWRYPKIKVAKSLIRMTGELLRLKEINDCLVNVDPHITGSEYGACIIQYFFSQNEKDDLKISYSNKLKNEPHWIELLNFTYSAFANKGQLDEASLDIIVNTTGTLFISQLRTHAKHQQVFHYPFEKERLLKLMKK